MAIRLNEFEMLPKKAFNKGWNGHLMTLEGKDSPSPPPAPDYTGAANATAAGNLEAARATASANKVNQVTPNGNLTYSINGKDSYGNDLYTATSSLSPAQQAIQDKNNSLTNGLLGAGQQGMNYVNQALANPITMANLPKSQINAGQTAQDAIMSRLNPQYDRLQNSTNNSLTNQGIMQGSEAWKNAQNDFGYQRNDAYQQAALNGISAGENAQNQQFQLQNAVQNQPINLVNALRTGNQVQNPQFTNVPQQSNVAGPDLTSAAMATGQANNNNYNSQVSSNNAGKGALGSLGGALGSAAIMSPVGTFSDRRLKENIYQIDVHKKTGLPIYKYDYVWGEPSYGVMADEVELIMPDAVLMMPNGYKAVNYSMLEA
jgi:hypothetical protein